MHAKVKIGNGVAKIWRLSSAVMENTQHSLRDAKKNGDEFNETTELDTMDTAWMRWKMKVKEIGIQEGKQMKREHGKRRRELTDAILMLGDVLEVEPDNQEAKNIDVRST